MTSPTPSPVLYGFATTADLSATGPAFAIRRSSVNGIYVQAEWIYDSVDEQGVPVNYRMGYSVFAVNSSGLAVRVERFDTLEDANDYVTNDGGGFFS